MVNETSDFRDQIDKFLKRNFPQIQMHGGNSKVIEADSENGKVKIQLSGACSGCGISPMTVQAIKSRMTDNIDNAETVEVITEVTDFDMNVETPEVRSESNEDEPEAPF
jgi:Fe/S biogenesis protein NfuA